MLREERDAARSELASAHIVLAGLEGKGTDCEHWLEDGADCTCGAARYIGGPNCSSGKWAAWAVEIGLLTGQDKALAITG